MTLMTLTAYAETHGVKKQSAAEWKTKGYLVMNGALVDAVASDARMKSAAKGRFRVKAHGGRREKGVRGAIDRPGMGYGPGAAVDKAGQTHGRWAGWHPVGNPNTLCSTLRSALAGGEEADIEDALDLIQFSDWDGACTAAGWDRWPSDTAPALAAELGLAGREGEVHDALHRLVRARLASLDISDDDLTDERLQPR